MNFSANVLWHVQLAALGAFVSIAATACGDDDVTDQKATNTSISSISINEVMTKNSSIESDTGKKSDWLEFYNEGDTEVSLEGYYISDDKDALLKVKLPSAAVVPAQGFLLIWLDGTFNADTPLHFPFKLSGDGENFYLSTPAGKIAKNLTIPADPMGANANSPDVSYGAYPDGSTTFGWCTSPTPKAKNGADCAPGADAGL